MRLNTPTLKAEPYMSGLSAGLSALREFILAQRAAAAAAPEVKMLQGVYRGYAGDNSAANLTGDVFAANQKPMADYYAARRAAQTGEAPHAEMLLIDPNVGRQYRIHPPGAREMSRVRKLPVEAVQDGSHLYAKGGEVKATPAKNEALAWLAEKLGQADAFARKPFGYDNPPVALISDLLGIPAVQRTTERLAYGEPLTTGRGWASRMRPDTEEAFLAAPQFVSPLGKVAQLTKGLPVGASIKMKGGNWLSGSVEDALKGLKRPEPGWGNTSAPDVAQALGMSEQDLVSQQAWRRGHGAINTPAGPMELQDALRAINPPRPPDYLNNWVDKQLTRYVKNDMATPEDPIRALAERGVLHYAPEVSPGPRARAIEHRIDADQVPHGMAKSQLAQDFETMSDASIGGHPAGDWMKNASPAVLDKNPWLAKVPPEVPVYEKTSPGLADNLGFSHLLDELRNATNPASGLPPELLLKYSSLPQVSVPQAVERVAAINAWREAQKVEANAAKANNPATVLHKDYPDKGFKWVELKAPAAKSVEDLSPEQMTWYDEYLQGGVSPERALQEASKRTQKTLEDALKYEGDTMGHCVGSYCDEVASGAKRIFSLRDAKGQPHTTIEMRPGAPAPEGSVPWEGLSDEVRANMSSRGLAPSEGSRGFAYTPEGRAIMVPIEPSIIQIKGKANRAPNPEYLPFVQDFVKSGKWSDVGDLQNTGLRRTSDAFNPTEQEFLRSKGVELKPYIEPEETARYQELFKRAPDAEPGYAAGGFVESGNQGYNPARVDALVNQLRTELFN